MTLRRKTLFITAITLVALTLIIFFSAHLVLHRGFARVEDATAHRNAIRAVNALLREVHGLEVKAHDWAAWDDTYAFIADRNSRYAESNLIPDSFKALEINFIVYIDIAGNIVYAKGYERDRRGELPVPASLIRLLARRDSLTVHTDPDHGVSGLIILPEGTLMLTSRPIVTSEEQGPIRGSLLFGRYIDSEELSRLEDITQLSLETRNWNDSALPADFREARAALSPEHPAFIRPLDNRSIAGYTLIRDVYGDPALMLRISMPRDIMAQEERSMGYLLAAILAVGMVFTGVSLLFLERAVLLRLVRLSRGFASIGLRGDFSGRIAEEGRDELTRVAEAGNRMLCALEESHNRIRLRNREMRTIMDTVPVGLITLDGDWRIGGEYSRSAEEMLGRKGLEGQDFLEMLGLSAPDREVVREYLELLRDETLPEDDLIRLNPFPELSLRRSDGEPPRWFRIGYNPIHREDSPTGAILVSVEDITGEKDLAEQVAKTEADAAQIVAVAENPDLFREFLAQASEIVVRLRDGARTIRKGVCTPHLLDDLMRDAHTLRGTSSAFGAANLAEVAGELEDQLSLIRGAGDVPPGMLDDLEHLEEHILGDLDSVRRKAASILRDNLRDDGETWLRVPLREIEAARQAADSLRREAGNGTGEDLAARLRSLRMVPARRGLARSVRIIEDLLRRTGMWVDFRFEGQEISLDCELARDLNNPLVHLFRNSLAHGIESPEERIAAGKPRHGTVALTIRSEDGRVVLEFADDGRGIDPERIRAAAVRRGLLTPEAAGALGPGECLNLVFVPGFSTSEQVGPLSGRGVGLDSVREDIRKLSGEVIIDRTHAPGTRFVISVPHPVA